MLTPLTPKAANDLLPPVSLDDNTEESEDADYTFDQVGMGEDFEWDVLALNPSASLLPQELLDLADQLGAEGIMQSAPSV